MSHELRTPLNAVIDDIPDISKIEAGKLELQEEVVPLREIIADCTGMLADRAQRAGTHLRTRVPEHFPRVRANPLRQRQIILNLLSNVLKFPPEDSQVTLALSRAAGGAPVIEVSDSGPVIDPADIPRVLEPFGQVGNTTSNAEGTGFGLSVSRDLGEFHGGRLEIESELGRGTTVRILLHRDCVVEG
jgi:two-component system cell cycle sensor histidine kinase PleC